MLKCVKNLLRVRWNLKIIGVERSCRFLLIGVVIAFVDNFWLIDNSWALVDNVRDKL